MTQVDVIAKILKDGDYSPTCPCSQCGHARAKAQDIWDAIKVNGDWEKESMITIEELQYGSRRYSTAHKE